MSAGRAKRLSKVRFADAGKHDRLAMPVILLLRKDRQLKVHETVMAGISHQIRSATSCQDRVLAVGCDRNGFRLAAGRGLKKINDRLFDLAALVSVSDQIDILAAVFENAALQNF